jgi:hypothetical protein
MCISDRRGFWNRINSVEYDRDFDHEGKKKQDKRKNRRSMRFSKKQLNKTQTT